MPALELGSVRIRVNLSNLTDFLEDLKIKLRSADCKAFQ